MEIYFPGMIIQDFNLRLYSHLIKRLLFLIKK